MLRFISLLLSNGQLKSDIDANVPTDECPNGTALGLADSRADSRTDECAYGLTDERAFKHPNGIADDVADSLSK